MNLRLSHLPIILASMACGAGVGWLLTFMIKPGTFPEFEKAVGLKISGLMCGAVAGAAVIVLRLISQAAHDPAAEASRNFTIIHGIGSTLIRNSKRTPQGSYIATEWFVVLWIPIFPVCRYRVTSPSRGVYEIHAKYPPQAAETIAVYILVAFGVVVFGAAAYLVKRVLPQ
jgi:hypothetical protein